MYRRGEERHKLLRGISITFGVLLLEAVGGLLTGSLALLADAGHMLMDLFSLLISFLAISFALRPPTAKFTYGLWRLEVLAALANGIFLVGICFYIGYEASTRIFNPPQVKSLWILGIASAGLVANLAVLFFIKGGKTLNLRSAFLHVLSDTLSSLGIIIGSVIMIFTGWAMVDPLISLFIAVLILISGWRVISEAVDILLEASPKGIDTSKVVKAISSVDGIKDVHDVHLWTISSGLYAMSAHLVVDDMPVSQSVRIADRVRDELLGLNICHFALQFENTPCDFCHFERMQSAL
jgi:cobalt-zinc-cadmium efflux system protein